VDPSVRIRRATRDDIQGMQGLEPPNWSPEHYEDLFRPTAPELSKYFVLVAEDSLESRSATVIASTSPIVAYLAAHCVDSDWELQYVVVARESRRHGIGERLLGELVEHVRSVHGREIFLEVRESNRNARVLYRKMGFEEIGRRKGYYADTAEEAIRCRLSLY
jgi:[ribosomal protein S18]-alanine N-acetyltransferase